MSKVADLLDRARSDTGLSNFGEDGFREGLEQMLASAEKEAKLNALGEASFHAHILTMLKQRLEIEQCYAEHPEIDEQEIVAPLFGLGLPRTGSTALSNMLAQDPNIRFLRNWEAQFPCPPPETATQDSDPRIALTEASMDVRNTRFPRMKTMLPSTATSPTECQTFMAQDFKSQLVLAMYHMPSYQDWLIHKADLVPTYRHIKRVLKLLQWRCPPTRWRLKNPSHSLFIGALYEVFPDARFWMTHRDIASVIPSTSDLFFEMNKAFSDDVDKVALGNLNTEIWDVGMHRMIAFRDSNPQANARFCDIYFAEVMKDPYPTLERLYAFLGEEFTQETRDRIEHWRVTTPRDKHGDHSYDAADYGIDLDTLRARFAFYTDRFNVPLLTKA